MAGWGNAGGRTPDRRDRRSPGAAARAGEYHDHGGNTPVGGRSLRGDAGLLERWWGTHRRDDNHAGGVDRLGSRDTHDPALRMQRLLVRDHLDNRSAHRRGGHLSGLTCPGGSPSSDHPESVDHHIACLDAGSARRGPSVGWVVDPTHRALERRPWGAQAQAGVAVGPGGPKWMGEATYVLGIRIFRGRSRRLLGLSQSMYIDTMVKSFGMENSKKGFIPMRHGVQISKEHSPKTLEDRVLMEKIPYASAIGSIMYAMLCIRPDLAYALSVMSRF